jgi:hypothetical protein
MPQTNSAGKSVGREEKFEPPSNFPAQSANKHLHFYRRANNLGKALPYFYDIEIDEKGAPDLSLNFFFLDNVLISLFPICCVCTYIHIFIHACVCKNLAL